MPVDRSLVADGDRLGRSAATRWGSGALPVKYGSPTVPMPGYDLQVLDDAGQAACRRARPARSPSSCRCRPSCLPTLWNNDERFRKSYLAEFPGYYTTSDAGYIDEDGYAFVMARTDDVINVAGHRLSTGADGGGRRPSTRTWPNAP